MTRLSTSKLREDLADALNRVSYRGERIVLNRRGKDVAVLVSMEDLDILEKLEDRLDYEAAEKALVEMKEKGEKPIPWKKVKMDLGFK